MPAGRAGRGQISRRQRSAAPLKSWDRQASAGPPPTCTAASSLSRPSDLSRKELRACETGHQHSTRPCALWNQVDLWCPAARLGWQPLAGGGGGGEDCRGRDRTPRCGTKSVFRCPYMMAIRCAAPAPPDCTTSKQSATSQAPPSALSCSWTTTSCWRRRGEREGEGPPTTGPWWFDAARCFKVHRRCIVV